MPKVRFCEPDLTSRSQPAKPTSRRSRPLPKAKRAKVKLKKAKVKVCKLPLGGKPKQVKFCEPDPSELTSRSRSLSQQPLPKRAKVKLKKAKVKVYKLPLEFNMSKVKVGKLPLGVKVGKRLKTSRVKVGKPKPQVPKVRVPGVESVPKVKLYKLKVTDSQVKLTKVKDCVVTSGSQPKPALTGSERPKPPKFLSLSCCRNHTPTDRHRTQPHPHFYISRKEARVIMASRITKLAEVLKFLATSRGFDRHLKPVELISASRGRCVCEMTVNESHLNVGGTLHGGFTANLVDTISTLAIISTESHPGVSVDMNISYLSTARSGDVLEIKSECVKRGKKLAFATVDVARKSDGQVIALGRQTKYIDSGQETSMPMLE